MATVLDKDLTRESSVKYNDREIQVTLTADQGITFKLKGMKSGALSISIEDLYKQLIGDDDQPVAKAAPKASTERVTKDNPTISLNELRTKINTTPMSMDTKALFDTFVAQCIKTFKTPFVEKELAAKEDDKNNRRNKLKN